MKLGFPEEVVLQTKSGLSYYACRVDDNTIALAWYLDQWPVHVSFHPMPGTRLITHKSILGIDIIGRSIGVDCPLQAQAVIQDYINNLPTEVTNDEAA